GFTPELREVLLTERNRNWIPEIEKALATDRDVMFLVGAAHLVGEDGVVDLLRDKGLTVTQVPNRAP
ncbi:MAG: TraB/GumN family protein, partial [Verrucomicrobia bacterium]|nr:TraB/GumN family protein [Verrucomicrobiota bacterium]